MADAVLRIQAENLTRGAFREVHADLSKLTTLTRERASGIKAAQQVELGTLRTQKEKINLLRAEERLQQDRLRTAALVASAEKRDAAESKRLLNERVREERYYLQLKERSQKAELRSLNDALTFRRTLIREEQKVQRQTEQNTKATRNFGGALDFVKGSLTSLAAELTIFAGIDLARTFVEASREMEGYRATLTALVGDSTEAERQLEEVLALSRAPGLTAQSAVREFVQLTAIDVGLERTVAIIREMGNALALAGQTDLSPALLGLRQIYQRSKLSQEEINQITERLGLASRVLKEEFGTAISEDIQAALDVAGQDIDDFTNRFIAGLEKLPRAPINTLTAGLNRLRGATFELNAAIGDRLSPTITAAVSGLEGYADSLRDVIQEKATLASVIEQLREQSPELGNFAEGIIALGEGLANAFEGVPEDLLSVGASLASITGNIATLTGALLELEGAGAVFRKVFGFDALQALDNLLQLVSAGSDELTGFLTGRGSDAFEALTADIQALRDAPARPTVGSLVSQPFQDVILDPLSGRGLADAAQTAGTLSANQSRLYTRESTLVGELEQSIAAANQELSVLRANVQDVVELAIGDRGFQALGRGAASSAETISDLNRQAAQTPGILGDITRNAVDYTSVIETLVPTVIDLVAAEQALNAAIAANNERIGLAVDGEKESLTARERAIQVYKDAEQALRDYERANLNASQAVAESNARIVAFNKTVGTADIDAAIDRLRDFDDAFAYANVNVPRLTSAMGRFTGTLPDAESGLRETTVELQNLSQAAVAANRELEYLQNTNAKLDAIALSSPGGGQSGFDVIAGGLGYRDTTDATIRLTTELLSTAISLTGELRNIEEERVASLVELEAKTSAQIQAINKRKAQALYGINQRILEEEERRFEEIKQLFRDAKNAEIAARQEAADAILAVETAADERRAAVKAAYFEEIAGIEAAYTADVEALREGLADRERERTEQLTALSERAAQDRLAAEQTYAETLQRIQNNLVDAVLSVRERLAADLEALADGLATRQAQRAEEETRLIESAAEDRIAAEDRYREETVSIQETLSNRLRDIRKRLNADLTALDEGLLAREAARAAERVAIAEEAATERAAIAEQLAADIAAAETTYQETRGRIATGLVTQIRQLETELADDLAALDEGLLARAAQRERERLTITETAAQDRAAAEQQYADTILSINENLVSSIRSIGEEVLAIERNAAAERERIAQDAVDARLSAEERYQRDVLRLQTDLGRELERIEDRRAANALRTAESLSDLELQAARRREDLQLRFERGVADSPDREADLRLTLERGLEDLSIQTARRESDIQTRAARETTALDTAEAEARESAGVEPVFTEAVSAFEQLTTTLTETLAGIDSDEQAALAAVDSERIEGIAAAHARILELEAEAGITFENALENLPETVDATTTALNTLQETLNRINTGEIGEIAALGTEDATDAAATATQRQGLIDAGAAERERLETAAGISFTDALTLAVPEISAMAQAAIDFNTTIATLHRQAGIDVAGVNAQEQADLGHLDAEGAADRAATATQRQGLIAAANADAATARSEAAEANTSALTTLNETIATLNANLANALLGISTQGRLDALATGQEQQGLIDAAAAEEARLEGEAGISFETALANYVPAVDAATAALNAFHTAIANINTQLGIDTDAVLAEGAADRAGTAADIAGLGEDRDAAVDAATSEYRAERVAITNQEAEDIGAIETTLSEQLTAIDAGISESLAAIRENKIEFDQQIWADIYQVNATANEELNTIRNDAALMRAEIEAIAAEARDNAWKSAMLKVANVGVTVLGAAVGAVVAGPAGAAVGAQIGGAAGGLLEQAGNELFHFPQTDAIAFNLARELGRARREQSALPTPTQLRNAQDLGREVITGFADGTGGGSHAPTGSSEPIQIEINAPVVIDGVEIGRIVDRILVENDINGVAIGSYT